MISIAAFTDATGKIDWEALRRAEIEAGESCYQCRGMIFPPKGRSSLCNPCRLMREEEGEVDHGSRLRCPKCGHLWKVEREEGDIHSEGSHEVCCPECDHEFEVVTEVSFSWRSPGLIERKDESKAGGPRGEEPVG